MTQPDLQLSGRRIVVTGGAGALGGAVVDRLAAGGAQVHVPCFEAEVPSELRDRANVHAVAGIDMTNEAAAAGFYADIDSLWASVHLAGGFGMGPIAETTLGLLQKLIALNLVTCFNACKGATLAMRKAGGGGRIVNVSAKPVLEPSAGANMSAYTATKAAVAGLTQALAEELAPEGILVNAIVPSIIDTPLNRSSMPDADHSLWPKPSELAHTIASLVSPTNVLVRGAMMPVYGRS